MVGIGVRVAVGDSVNVGDGEAVAVLVGVSVRDGVTVGDAVADGVVVAVSVFVGGIKGNVVALRARTARLPGCVVLASFVGDVLAGNALDQVVTTATAPTRSNEKTRNNENRMICRWSMFLQGGFPSFRAGRSTPLIQ